MIEMLTSLRFYPQKGITTDFIYVRSTTFFFFNKEHYVGFVKSRRENFEFKINKDYEEVIFFPSINYTYFMDMLLKAEKNSEYHITLGKKIVGEGKILYVTEILE